MRTIAIISLVCALILIGPLAAHVQAASDQPGFELLLVPNTDPQVTEKGYFIYHIAANVQATGQVLVRNLGTQPVTVALAAIDAITSQTGGSAFATSDKVPAAVALWLELEHGSVTLAPKSQQSVGFTVHAPASAAPGQYLAGISASESAAALTASPVDTTSQFGSTIATQKRYVIGVEVDIPGAANPHLSITGVKLLAYPSGTFVGVEMHNDGGMFLKPSGTLVVSDAQGKELLRQTMTMGTFVTGTEITYPVAWPGVVAPGSYAVSVELGYGASQPASYHSAIDISDATAAEVALPINTDPQSAANNQALLGDTGFSRRVALIAGSLVLAFALLGLYAYRRRRTHGQVV